MTVLHKGDIIYSEEEAQEGAQSSTRRRPHIVQPGESMYTISQKIRHPHEVPLQDEQALILATRSRLETDCE